MDADIAKVREALAPLLQRPSDELKAEAERLWNKDQDEATMHIWAGTPPPVDLLTRISVHHWACKAFDAPDLIEQALDLLATRISELEVAQPAIIEYLGNLYGAAKHDWETANPADVGLHGIPVKAWRDAYLEGIKNSASGVVSKFPAREQEATKALFHETAARAALQAQENAAPPQEGPAE